MNVQKDGYEDYESSWLVFSATVEDITHDVALTPEPSGTVRGRVYDMETNEALADATVILIGYGYIVTSTDSNGEYVFTDLERGDEVSGWRNYDIAAGTQGYKVYYTEQPLAFSEGVMVITHDVALTPRESSSGTIRGVVYSYVRDHAERFSGATVTLTSSDGTREYETTTNSDGEYLFDVLRYVHAGDRQRIYLSYTLHVVEEDHDEFHSGALVFSQGTYDFEYNVIVQFIWWGPGTISGHVYDAATDRAIAGATVSASAMARGNAIGYTTITDSDGYYELTNVARYSQSSGGNTTYLSYTLEARVRRYRRFKSGQFSFSDKVHDITYDVPMRRGYQRTRVDLNASGDDETVFASIQEAIDNVDDGGEVFIEPGVYMENVEITRPITMAANFGSTDAMPEIRGNGSTSTVYVHDFDGSVTIRGLKITNGGTGYVDSDYTNGGIYAARIDDIYVEDSVIRDNYGSGVCLGNGIRTATITDNVVSNNAAAWTAGGGISITSSSGNAHCSIRNNLIANNSAQAAGGVYATALGSGTLELVNNTIVHNATERGSNGSGIFAITSADLDVRNNIVYGNTTSAPTSKLKENVYLFNVSDGSDSIDYDSVTYNNIEGLSDNNGSVGELGNNIDVDPMFVSKEDLRIREDSLCIDAGDPAEDYSNELGPNGGRINLGAYGNTQEAARSVTQSNSSPVLLPIGDKEISVGEYFYFPISATDPDGDEIRYSMDGLPEEAYFRPLSASMVEWWRRNGHNLSDSGYYFFWYPKDNRTGEYRVTFSAEDLNTSGQPKSITEEEITITIKAQESRPTILLAENYQNLVVYWLGNDAEDGRDLVYSYNIDHGEWSNWGSEYHVLVGSISSGLDIGEHALQVKARDKDGLESEPRSVRFDVR
ncbi:MAG: carboxypeptidase regulatory-like domain-containing protein [Candidatus Omnitrophica bacterium]|nr:carboxypeptidase regulatory-like domain-containing protein [Candidatus Omnitrophota bacterium]